MTGAGLGTIIRSNGERQVTYEGTPLYRCVLDHVPGRIEGEGDGWSVVQLHAEPSATTTKTMAVTERRAQPSRPSHVETTTGSIRS